MSKYVYTETHGPIKLGVRFSHASGRGVHKLQSVLPYVLLDIFCHGR
jgi:hypothetical protein